MKPFEYVQTYFIVITALVALIGLLGAFYRTLCRTLYSQFFKDEHTFKKFKKHLGNNQPLELYHDMIKGLLSKTEIFFGKPLRFRAFDRILLIALIYPVLFFMICYWFSGSNLVSGSEVFPGQINWVLRTVVLFLYGILFSLIFFFLTEKSDSIDTYVVSKINFKSELINNIINFFIDVIKLVIAGACFIFVVSIVVSIGGSVASAVGVAIVVSGLSVVSVVSVKRFGGATIGALSCFFMFIAFFIATVFVATYFDNIIASLSNDIAISGEKSPSDTLSMSYVGSLFASIGVANNAHLVAEFMRDVSLILMFFLIILPLANSLFDLISFEFSRWLTMKSIALNNKLKIFLILVIDLLIAIGLLLGTGLFVSSLIEVFNEILSPCISNAKLIDWKALAILGKNSPFSEGLSVTLILFSTLVWTGVHAIFAFCSLVLAPIGHNWMYSLLKKEGITNIELGVGAVWLTSNVFISIVCLFVIPCFFISYLWKVPIAEYLYDFVMKYHFSF